MSTNSERDDFFQRLDVDAADRLYRRVSIDPERFRRILRTSNRRTATDGADAREVRETGEWALEQSAFKVGAVGGVAGLTGVVTVPAEIATRGLATLRLAQKLLLVYGFEPATDQGKTVLWRVLAAGLEVPLPSNRPVGMGVSDLPRALRKEGRSVSQVLTSALLRSATRSVTFRLLRFVPLASAAGNARSAKQRMAAVGVRMLDLLDRLYVPAPSDDITDVIELS